MTEAVKKFIVMSIWVTIIAFVIRCLISWGDLSAFVANKKVFECGYSIFGYAGEAIGIAAIFMACFNKWWWRWKPLNRISGGMPVLAKKYKGKIQFIWDEQEQERDSEISIEQTFLNVIVKLGTDESSSNSVAATIKEENGSKMLIYTYLNTPRAEIQDKSVIHYGTAMLIVDDPKHLTGNYFTIRKSRGSMDLMAVDETEPAKKLKFNKLRRRK